MTLDDLSRRRLLQGGSAALGLALLGTHGRASAYEAGRVPTPARVSGAVRWAGRATAPARLKLTGDCAYCRKFDLRAEELLQAPGGGLRNVVVFLEGIARGKQSPVAAPRLAELRCTFVPHVLTMAAGTKLVLHNQDPVLNTFHAVELTGGTTLFNLGLAVKDQQAQRRIPRPGVVKMLCDVHPWEVAWIVAFAHPYHAVSDAAGRFALDDVPPGDYTLGLWHEKLGGRRQPLRVGPGAQLKLDLVYPA